MVPSEIYSYIASFIHTEGKNPSFCIDEARKTLQEFAVVSRIAFEASRRMHFHTVEVTSTGKLYALVTVLRNPKNNIGRFICKLVVGCSRRDLWGNTWLGAYINIGHLNSWIPNLQGLRIEAMNLPLPRYKALFDDIQHSDPAAPLSFRLTVLSVSVRIFPSIEVFANFLRRFIGLRRLCLRDVNPSFMSHFPLILPRTLLVLRIIEAELLSTTLPIDAGKLPVKQPISSERRLVLLEVSYYTYSVEALRVALPVLRKLSYKAETVKIAAPVAASEDQSNAALSKTEAVALITEYGLRAEGRRVFILDCIRRLFWRDEGLAKDDGNQRGEYVNGEGGEAMTAMAQVELWAAEDGGEEFKSNTYRDSSVSRWDSDDLGHGCNGCEDGEISWYLPRSNEIEF